MLLVECMTLWGWAWVRYRQSMQEHDTTHNENVWISDCMSRLPFIAGELHASGVTLHTNPAHHDTQQERWYIHGQLKALITADECTQVDIATTYKSLLCCSRFCCCPCPMIFPLAKLHWSLWATCHHCWCAVYMKSLVNKWHGQRKALLPSLLFPLLLCSFWRGFFLRVRGRSTIERRIKWWHQNSIICGRVDCSKWSVQTSICMHVCNEVTLVWGSLRLTPINCWSYPPSCTALDISKSCTVVDETLTLHQIKLS